MPIHLVFECDVVYFIFHHTPLYFPRNIDFCGNQLSTQIYTSYPLICYPHPPLIHYHCGLILRFVFCFLKYGLSSHFFGLFGICLRFLLLIIYLIYWFYFIRFLSSNLIFLNIFITALLITTSSRIIGNIICDVASCSSRL